MSTLAYEAGSYTWTADDRLWLLRAVTVEGEPRELVARALINGYCWARSRRRNRRTLTEWIRAYAQPVNPRWCTGGDLLAQACRNLSSHDADLERRRAHLRATLHCARLSFAPIVQLVVDRALTSPWESDITDYAAPHVDAAFKGYIPRTEPKPRENRFWTRAPGWRGYTIAEDHRVA